MAPPTATGGAWTAPATPTADAWPSPTPPLSDQYAEGVTTIRRAAAEDVAALVELRAEMFHAMDAAAAEDGWRDSAQRWFATRINDPYCCFVVVEVAHTVVSCAIGIRRDTPPSPGNPSGGDVHINNVCTRPEHRGRGYASLALAEVMRWAQTMDTGRAELMATASGIDIYARQGFRVHRYPAMRASLA